MWFKFPKTLLLEARIKELEEELRERRDREAHLIDKIVMLAGLNPLPKPEKARQTQSEITTTIQTASNAEFPPRRSLKDRQNAAQEQWRQMIKNGDLPG